MRTRRISVKQTVTVSESLVAVLILVLIQFMGYMRSTRIDHRRRSCHIGWGRCFHFPARGRTGGSVPARRPRRLVPGGDGDGGGHHEHVAQRRDPPLVHAVVVRAELHLALVRGDLHRVRRALVGARLLRGARPHVADHACGCVSRWLPVSSVRPRKKIR